MNNLTKLISAIYTLLLISGCQVSPYDYSALIEANPRSILVIPPTNDSTDVTAPYTFISTISKPLAEKGYYVFPVAVVETFMKENGLPTPAEMNNVPVEKLRETINPDAVLYVNINNWGQEFKVISSQAVVDSTARLIDARTGTLLWDARIKGVRASSDGGGGIIGAIVGAVAEQVVGSLTDHTQTLSSQTNTTIINMPQRGLLPGPLFTQE